MPMSVYERRRVAVLGAVTVLVVLLARSCSGGDGNEESAVSATTVVAPVVDDSVPAPVILTGPSPVSPSGSAVIAYPAENPLSVEGIATFTNFGFTSSAVCYSTTVPPGLEMTVTNLNNGRRLQCVSSYSLLVPGGVTIMLHTSKFVELADLVDSPIPISVEW
jgi:hypothetical protein